MLKKVWKPILGSVLGGSGVGLYYYTKSDPGSARSLEFWKIIGPIYLQYRYVQFLNDDIGWINDSEAGIRYNDLHNRYTEDVKITTYRLRGFYLKTAQLMSIQDNFIPKAYMTWLKDTQDNVPSEFNSPEEVHEYVANILKTELNLTFDEVFEEFDYNPVGIASIGQVHRARLRDTHQEVAVKFQLPGMESRFRADIATIKMFCQLATPQFLPSFNEIEKQFCTEFDYTGEGKNLADIYDVVMKDWSHEVTIPRPYLNLCSKHILVMEFLEGIKLVDGIRAQYRAIAAQAGDPRSYEEIEKEKIEALRSGTLKLKSLQEAQKEHEYITWMLYMNNWIFSLNPLRYAYNQTISPLCHLLLDNSKDANNSWDWKYQLALGGTEGEAPLIDLGHMLKVLCEVHADQIFQGGAFNGDPHPGNILLMPNGKLGLIDYGQVKRMSLEQRITFAKLIIALARDDRSEIVRIYTKEMGYQTKYNNPDLAYRHACFYCDRDTDDITLGKNMHLFLEWMEKSDPVAQLPEDYLMASRVTLMMRGLAKAFGLQIKVSEIWKENAERFLLSQGIQY